MNPLSIKTYFIGAVVVAGIASTATWQIQSWRYEAKVATFTTMHRAELAGRDQLLQNIRDEANRQLLEQQQAQQKRAERLAALDTRHYQELRRAQNEADRLRADLTAGRRRLYVDTNPNQDSTRGDSVSGNSDAPRVDDGAKRTELHSAIAGLLVGITVDADECAAKLTALQDWLKMLHAP